MSKVEEILLKRFRDGDMDAFEQLFRSYHPTLLFYARSIVPDNTAAEDIIHDLFLNLWDKRKMLIIHTSVRAYLIKGTRNRCLNYLRNEKIRISGEQLSEEIIESLYTPISEGILGRIFADELREQISKIIEELPEKRKSIFLLSRSGSYSIKDIARKFNISENTVKTQIFRSLQKIRAELGKFLTLL